MEFMHVVWLAIVQGLTEFLPISSSAHLILVPPLLGWPDQGLAFDVAVHLGTLIAVVVYFREDIIRMIVAWFGSLAGKGFTPDAKLAWGVILGTIPAGLAGLIFKDFIKTNLREPLVIAATTIIFGLLLYIADRFSKRVKTEHQMGWGTFLGIGAFQALALIPGTSRSGITITAALLLGYTREAAARFSFLLSIPIITLSGLLVTKDLVEAAEPVDWLSLGLGTALSFAAAFACIYVFLKWIERAGMLPFVIYRLLLGAFLVVVFL
jgi:undecaprenyl-diphosphatase